jgi:type III secretory pathway component EscU
MELILIFFLVMALSGLFLMNRQERLRGARFSRRTSDKIYSEEDYLKKVLEKTDRRLKEEKQEQSYKNNIKKDYL